MGMRGQQMAQLSLLPLLARGQSVRTSSLWETLDVTYLSLAARVVPNSKARRRSEAVHDLIIPAEEIIHSVPVRL